MKATYDKPTANTVHNGDRMKAKISDMGYYLTKTEPLKLVIATSGYGYTGNEIANILRSNGIECEFSDNEHIVLMSTPENTRGDFERLLSVLSEIERKSPLPLTELHSLSSRPVRVTSIRNATLGRRETVDVNTAEGRVCATPAVSCPPAVPIVASGEIITNEHIELFKHYGIDTIEVCITK